MLHFHDDFNDADDDKVPGDKSASQINLPSSLTITTKSKELLSKDIKDEPPSCKPTSALPLPLFPQPDKQVG